MEYRRFGPTDMTVSALGFGCWEMGGTYGDVTERGVSAAVSRAIDLGINCFDTAPAYGGGESEVLLGRALGARRKDVIVAPSAEWAMQSGPRAGTAAWYPFSPPSSRACGTWKQTTSTCCSCTGPTSTRLLRRPCTRWTAWCGRKDSRRRSIELHSRPDP